MLDPRNWSPTPFLFSNEKKGDYINTSHFIWDISNWTPKEGSLADLNQQLEDLYSTQHSLCAEMDTDSNKEILEKIRTVAKEIITIKEAIQNRSTKLK